jgi:hypothetical protein
MYASERAEIQRAFEIDPTDPDIQRAWKDILSSANESKSIDQSLATVQDLNVKDRQTAEASFHSLMSRLSENSQTCQVLPTVASATLRLLLPSLLEDKRQQVYRYQLDVQFPQSSAKLLVDTAASGLFISRELAEQNHLHPDTGAPEGTVHVDSVHIGPLEFRDCTVGVSDTPFPDKADGIGQGGRHRRHGYFRRLSDYARFPIEATHAGALASTARFTAGRPFCTA